MNKIANELRGIVLEFTVRMSTIADLDFSIKPNPEKWSKKEVLGHLIDSAQNNIRRFICSQYELTPPHIVYQQDFWVKANQYQDMDQADIIDLWRLINLRICAVLESMSEENKTRQCDTGELHTLEWLALDYIKHMKHHLNQIISGSFDVVYSS